MSEFLSPLRHAASMIAGVVVLGLVCAAPASAATLSGAKLTKALKGGGYVILMRHASAPAAPPSKGTTEPDNKRDERQLDQAGEDSARAAGAAIRALRIPVGTVYCSPTYRARETARLVGLPAPKIERKLGDGGSSKSAGSVSQWAGWLKQQVVVKPRPGTDTVFVTQYPNIRSAFPLWAKGMGDGGALVLKPNGKSAQVVAQVQMTDWPKLAKSQ